jgi:cytochrome c-type biogenesis protein CcmH/NrfG
MAWAMGSYFNYPKFKEAVSKLVPDFKTAAIESYMPDNPEKDITKPPTDKSLRDRNLANKQLFLNAQAALDRGLPHDVLQWAEGVAATAGKVATEAAEEAGKAARSPLGVIGGVVMVLGLSYAGYKMYQQSKAGTSVHREPRETMLPEEPHDEIHELGERLDRVQST